MATIDVDFDVFKELTVRRATESTTYNDVIRNLLGMDSAVSIKPQTRGATFKGIHFPDGTQFRAAYKGQEYTAEIKMGRWIDSDGKTSTSPSQAAVKITNKPWNGWLFWSCLRPGDSEWTLIDKLRSRMTTEELLAHL